MTENEKLKLISEYKNAVREFIEAVSGISAEGLDFRPQKDFWTIREHVAHVLDCEAFGFTRYRKSIAQAGSGVEGFEQDPWQSGLDYSVMDINKAIKIIELLSDITANHLVSIPDKDWTDFYINHPERGRENLEKLVGRRIAHTKEHIGYINRNKALLKT